LAHMSIRTYFRPNIHQNGPEILGVKRSWSSTMSIGHIISHLTS
jgi:hypothetical protein